MDAADFFNSIASTPVTPSKTVAFSHIFNKNPARASASVEDGIVEDGALDR